MRSNLQLLDIILTIPIYTRTRYIYIYVAQRTATKCNSWRKQPSWRTESVNLSRCKKPSLQPSNLWVCAFLTFMCANGLCFIDSKHFLLSWFKVYILWGCDIVFSFVRPRFSVRPWGNQFDIFFSKNLKNKLVKWFSNIRNRWYSSSFSKINIFLPDSIFKKRLDLAQKVKIPSHYFSRN